MKVYLAGPICGLTYQKARSWRHDAETMLREHRVEARSPMRAKEQLDAYTLGTYPKPLGTDQLNPWIINPVAVRRDLRDIRSADVVLANLSGAKQVSIGTVAEIAYAYALGKYVVVVLEPGNMHEHIFIEEMASVVVPTLVRAVRWITEVLLS